jgi:hypothetical protein
MIRCQNGRSDRLGGERRKSSTEAYSPLASVRPRRRSRNKPAPGTPGWAFLIGSGGGADAGLCHSLRMWRRCTGVRVRLERAAAVRLAVIQAPLDVRSAVHPAKCYTPVTGRTALDGHDVLGRSFVQTDGDPRAPVLHFTGLRIRVRHGTDLPCWSADRQRLNATPLFASLYPGQPRFWPHGYPIAAAVDREWLPVSRPPCSPTQPPSGAALSRTCLHMPRPAGISSWPTGRRSGKPPSTSATVWALRRTRSAERQPSCLRSIRNTGRCGSRSAR